MRAILVRAALLVVLALAAGCGGGGDSTGPGNPPSAPPPPAPPPPPPPPSSSAVDTVLLLGNSFSPATLTVAPGRTVVWVNTVAMLHTVTPDGHGQWTTASTSAPGEVLRVTFSQAGSFDYFCEPHQAEGMTGRITVQQ